MSKTLERTDTRERLLECAQDLMLRKGFVATSVDEICEAAGVTK
jgi:TetR/AcrR family transcriptional regulator, transcriptional repressor for nem operon